jgi:hypothetical protein
MDRNMRRLAVSLPLFSFCILSTLLALALQGCGGSAPGTSRQPKVYAPEDMPEICQDIDFNQAGKEIKEECGVQTRNYRAYKNIPEHRNLLLPKGAKIVRKGKGLELRLLNTLPIALPSGLEGKLLFDEKLRRTFVKTKMDYCEFFPENSADRLRIIKLDIPFDLGGETSICYTVESRPTTAQRNAGYAGRLEALECSDFLRLKAVSGAQGTDSIPDVIPGVEKPATGTGEPGFKSAPAAKGAGKPVIPGAK